MARRPPRSAKDPAGPDDRGTGTVRARSRRGGRRGVDGSATIVPVDGAQQVGDRVDVAQNVAQGCRCAPDETIRWLVVSLLGLAGTATLMVRWWRQRRARRDAAPPADPTPSVSDPRSRAELWAP